MAIPLLHSLNGLVGVADRDKKSVQICDVMLSHGSSVYNRRLSLRSEVDLIRWSHSQDMQSCIYGYSLSINQLYT